MNLSPPMPLSLINYDAEDLDVLTNWYKAKSSGVHRISIVFASAQPEEALFLYVFELVQNVPKGRNTASSKGMPRPPQNLVGPNRIQTDINFSKRCASRFWHRKTRFDVAITIQKHCRQDLRVANTTSTRTLNFQSGCSRCFWTKQENLNGSHFQKQCFKNVRGFGNGTTYPKKNANFTKWCLSGFWSVQAQFETHFKIAKMFSLEPRNHNRLFETDVMFLQWICQSCKSAKLNLFGGQDC